MPHSSLATPERQPLPTPANTAAVIVTYHPQPDALASMAVLQSQVARIIIVDNGSPATVIERLNETARSSQQIELMINAENMGIAQALKIGRAHV